MTTKTTSVRSKPLYGYDHMEDEEAEEMEMKEIKALMILGFDNPYADRDYVLD